MKTKLSKIQQKTLDKMEAGKWYNAYQLGVRISTMIALKNKKLVKMKKDEMVWLGWEGTSIYFRKV